VLLALTRSSETAVRLLWAAGGAFAVCLVIVARRPAADAELLAAAGRSQDRP